MDAGERTLKSHILSPSLPCEGGISGASASYHLRRLRPDLKIALLESRQLSCGATGRNGGLLWPR